MAVCPVVVKTINANIIGILHMKTMNICANLCVKIFYWIIEYLIDILVWTNWLLPSLYSHNASIVKNIKACFKIEKQTFMVESNLQNWALSEIIKHLESLSWERLKKYLFKACCLDIYTDWIASFSVELGFCNIPRVSGIFSLIPFKSVMSLPCMSNLRMFAYLKPGAMSSGPLSSTDSCEAYAAVVVADARNAMTHLLDAARF